MLTEGNDIGADACVRQTGTDSKMTNKIGYHQKKKNLNDCFRNGL